MQIGEGARQGDGGAGGVRPQRFPFILRVGLCGGGDSNVVASFPPGRNIGR